MMKNILVAGLVAAVAAAAAYWFGVAQPARQAEAERAEHAVLQAGIQAYRDRNYEEALRVLADIPDRGSHAATARYYQGSAYILLNDYPAAAAQLERSLALNSQNADTLFALGVVHFKLGNLPLSKSYFAAVLEIFPETEQDKARMEEARGLMDIMARLERQQEPAAPDGEAAHEQGPAPETPAAGEQAGTDD